MTARDYAPIVEAEEFAGGPMMQRSWLSLGIDPVQLETESSGAWTAICGRCGRSCSSFTTDRQLSPMEAEEYEKQALEDFLVDHRECTRSPLDPPPQPAPSPTTSAAPHPTVWVVKQASGGDVRVLAEWHSTVPRDDGTELRFYNRHGDDQQRVATVRAGSWHWVVAATALDPKGGES